MSGGGPSHQTVAPPLSLLDMPAAWLQGLPAAVGEHILHLFRCCRALRDLVLSELHITLGQDLPIPPHQQAAAQAKLLLFCRRSARVKLTLTSYDRSPASASQFLNSTMAAAGQPLTAIVRVTLWGLALDALVPPWLTSTCPNIRSLALSQCRITLPSSTTSIPQCPQLKQLELFLVDSSHLPSNEPDRQAWQQHLRTLPNLTSLSLSGEGFGGAEGRQFLQCCSLVLSSQITQFCLPWQIHAELDLQQLVTWFTCVHDLQLSHSTVDDKGMEALLSLGSLRKLQCKGFQLQHSYTHRPCPWTHLGFTHLDVASFDRLPVVSMQLTGTSVEAVTPSKELGVNARVAAAAVRAGMQWGTYVYLDNTQAQADTACLTALMPMLSTCKAERFTLAHIRPVTPDLLAAMVQHMPRTGVLDICFTRCILNHAVWPLLLPSLPPVDDIVFVGSAVTEAQVTEMCVHACRPVLVAVHTGGWQEQWLEGWEGRVQAAMAAAGHQHVELLLR